MLSTYLLPTLCQNIWIQIVVQGVPGEGKTVAACQAGQALFRPPVPVDSKEDPNSVKDYFQAIYTADLANCKTKDALDEV